MRKCIFFTCMLASSVAVAQTGDYAIRDVDFTKVKLNDRFWLPRIETNRTVTIPASFARCESTGRVQNFIMAAQRKGKFCTRYPFDDTDVYKTIEGASFSLAVHPDKALERYVDSLIIIIKKAQEPDGYLYTARTIDPAHTGSWVGKERWEKEREMSHELYNAGHLYEAAAAHFRATHKRNLLDIALKNADLVCSVFGPGKKSVAPGHEIVEMGLVKLYRITHKKEYLTTAKFFIEARGHYNGYDTRSKDPWKNGAYWQDNKPVTQQEEAEGHAVRAGYLYAAVADVAALTGDDSLIRAADKIFDNVVSRKIYVQGSVGAVGDGERYGDNYELPNATAYNETCASVAEVYWYYRMFLLHGDARYIDVLEKTLYNGLLSGVGLDGKSFFYTNAMQVNDGEPYKGVERIRSGWFECSCCPTNLARFIPSIPGYMYATGKDRLYVNLFIGSTAELQVNHNSIRVTQQNDYPWSGDLKFRISSAAANTFNLMIRIPGWAGNKAIPSDLYRFTSPVQDSVIVKVNGVRVTYSLQQGYAVIKKVWGKNDLVEVTLPMEIRKVAANDQVKEDIGKIALQRGPVMYCAEWKDNQGKTSNILIPESTQFQAAFMPGLLNGVMTLNATVPAVVIEGTDKVATKTQAFTAIPYYSWANRGEGEMSVWFPTEIKNIQIQSK